MRNYLEQKCNAFGGKKNNMFEIFFFKYRDVDIFFWTQIVLKEDE